VAIQAAAAKGEATGADAKHAAVQIAHAPGPATASCIPPAKTRTSTIKKANCFAIFYGIEINRMLQLIVPIKLNSTK